MERDEDFGPQCFILFSELPSFMGPVIWLLGSSALSVLIKCYNAAGLSVDAFKLKESVGSNVLEVSRYFNCNAV